MSVSSSVKSFEQTNDSLSSSYPKKVLYFSDGTLDIDDLDGESATVLDSKSNSAAVNPRELTWIPWVWYQTVSAGSKALEVCDYVGESLASFFGITTPKYQFELNEYYRMKKEEADEMTNDIELGDWTKKFKSDEAGKGSIEAVSIAPKTLIGIKDNT